MMFLAKEEVHKKVAFEGVTYKTPVHGEKTLLSEFKLTKGCNIPNHKHPHEQTGYMVSGHVIFLINEERFDTLPGSTWTISSNVEHGVEVLEDSIVVEVFSPVREEHL